MFRQEITPEENRDSYHNNPLLTFHLSHSWLVWYMVIIDSTFVSSVAFSALQDKTSACLAVRRYEIVWSHNILWQAYP